MRAVLDASAVRVWCRAAADDLDRAREVLDALNVFPVADADTGTNLHLTMTAAADALADPAAGPDTAERAWAAMSRAALLGAHGNSGVILSQLLRGVAERAPADGAALAAALRHAADVAYAAVGDPVEGTMLTVAEAAARAAEAASGDAGAASPGGEGAAGDAGTAGATAGDAGAAGATAGDVGAVAPGGADAAGAAASDVGAVAAAAADAAWEALQRTPEQLAALADAGVVDAGAAGLVVVLDALARACGEPRQDGPRVPAPRHGVPAVTARSSGPAYEVMYLLDAADDALPALRTRLAELGDSLVVVGGEGEWNVHVHVDDAGAAVEAGLAAGRPHRVRVTHLLATIGEQPGGGRCVVAVAPSTGLGELVAAGGARCVVSSGDGPDADAVCAAVAGDATEVVLLPDGAGTLGTVTLAAERLRGHGVRAAAVPARALVQSLAALAVHQPEQPFEADLVAMTAAAVATRHTAVPVDAADPAAAAVAAVLDLLAGGASEDGELVTLVAGPDVPAGLTGAVVERLGRAAPGVESVVYENGPRGPVLLVGVE